MDLFRWRLERPQAWLAGAGYRLYGALGAMAGREEAARWHGAGRSPIAQHVGRDAEGLYWQVALLDGPAQLALADALAACTALELERERLSLRLAGHWRITPEALWRHHWDNPAPGTISLAHRSPSCFRRGGATELLPTADLLWPALARSWEARFPVLPIAAPGLALDEGVQLWAHRLYSAALHMKGQALAGFMGETRWQAASEARARLYGFLAAWGSIAGLGNKTALGMGGLEAHAPGWTALPATAIMKAPQ